MHLELLNIVPVPLTDFYVAILMEGFFFIILYTTSDIVLTTNTTYVYIH